MSDNLEKFIYPHDSSIRQVNVTPLFRYIIDCHELASMKGHHNVFFITSFIIRFLLISKQLEDNNKTHRKQTDERYNRFMKYMLFSNSSNIDVNFKIFTQRLSYGLKFCFHDIGKVDTVYSTT